MSKSVVEVALSWSECYGKENLEAALEFVSSDADWLVYGSAPLPWPELSKGHEGILSTWKLQHEHFEREFMNIESTMVQEDELVIFGVIGDVARRSQKKAIFNFSARFLVCHGRIQKYQMYLDPHVLNQALLS